MANIFIGIDSGTQSTKTIVVNGDNGKVLGSASQAYDLIPKLPPGHKEQHPKSWIDAVQKTVRAALKAAKVKVDDVRAIGVSGQQHGFVPLDKTGNVIRPAKLWCDTSTAPQCEEIIKKIGGLSAVIELIGNGVPPGFTASKILWLKQNEPANFKKLATVLLPHDYINYWLTGRAVMEHGDASGTALMDVRSRKWCEKVVNAIDSGLMSKLPKIQDSSLPVGHLRKEAAKALGLPANVLVSAGGGDNMMGAIGTGNTRPGLVTASFGTSGTIYACAPKPIIDPVGEIAAFCDSTGRWLPLLCAMNVTVATEMVRNDFGWTHAQYDAAVKKAPVGSDGLLLIPYLEGERTPNVPDGTGVYFGVNQRTFQANAFARATMEGVTLGMNYGLNRLRALGLAPTQIRVTGGGSNSAAWRQIMADVFNAEVICTQTAEGAAFGAALQSLWCWRLQKGDRVGISEITDAFVKTDPKTVARPNKKNVETYRKLQAIQDRAHKDMREMFAKHREIVS
ncbi:MAG: xylulokinase [Verrucomicrobiae bacterium]|nr:xylulokinase [Verrucomicrobiae bacterium]